MTVPDEVTRRVYEGPEVPGTGISARTAVRVSLFFITRGFCYVPVTYTSLAFWNYFKFLDGIVQNITYIKISIFICCDVMVS